MAATPSVVIRKSFTYRGNIQVFSNRYHFNGGTPADLSHWNALFDAIVLAEKVIYKGDVTITQAVGYAAGSNVAVASKAYTTVGTSASGAPAAPGDSAALIRYATTARTLKGHPIYLFNYVHRALIQTAPNQDSIDAAWRTVLQTYADAWLTGFSDGTNTYVRAGPNGATATARLVEAFVTHRDFPR